MSPSPRPLPATAWPVLLLLLLAVTAVSAVSAAEDAAMTPAVPFPAEGPLRLLFIHHSCGGQLLADPGEQVGGARGSGERYLREPSQRRRPARHAGAARL